MSDFCVCDDAELSQWFRQFTASIDPESEAYDMISEEEDVEVQMPAPEMKHHLLQLYFTYVHPFFPVIHKQDFLYNYNAL